jgi:hypothetical protein
MTTKTYRVFAKIGSIPGLKPPAIPLEGVDADMGDCGGDTNNLDEALTLAADYPNGRVYDLDGQKFVT